MHSGNRFPLAKASTYCFVSTRMAFSSRISSPGKWSFVATKAAPVGGVWPVAVCIFIVTDGSQNKFERQNGECSDCNDLKSSAVERVTEVLTAFWCARSQFSFLCRSLVYHGEFWLLHGELARRCALPIV